jgi:hypothetical protein
MVEKTVYDYRLRESPLIWYDKSLGTKVLRTAGWEEGRRTEVLYHAESPEQAASIKAAFVRGDGYSVGPEPVFFEPVEVVPDELGRVADESIQRYRKTRSVPCLTV